MKLLGMSTEDLRQIWESQDSKLEILWWIVLIGGGLLWVAHALAIVLITGLAFVNAIQSGRLS
tara:strand:+ start:213 stop:401 length:189 start_codon:yes stop_codon:yes gene_type:complete